MLQIIRMLDAGTVRGLIVATVPLLVLIGSFFGLDEAIFKTQLEGVGEKIVALVSLGGITWAAWARLFKPTPPLTETAAKATEQRLVKEMGAQGKDGTQGGVTLRAPLVGVLLALSLALASISGCKALGLEPADTFNKRLAAGYTTVTAVREAALVHLEGQVAKASDLEGAERRAALATLQNDAQNIQGQADNVREGLDIAASLRDVDFKTAELRLASSLRILDSLQRYLEGK